MTEETTILRQKRSQNSALADLTSTGLYHSFRLPDGRVIAGAMSLELQERRVSYFGLPERLDGLRVLDIGPWDGYFTFEMERRGAEVTAIDYVDLDTFRALHRAFGSRADYRRLDVYELDGALDGMFDITLCLGVLYHLKHPILALEKICSKTSGVCIVESFVVDGEAWQQGVAPSIPYAEFYERSELAGQLDNWFGPSVDAIEAWVRAAGFAEAEVLQVSGTTACIAAHRKWKRLPSDDLPAIQVVGVTCHLHRGRSFRTHKEEYIELWCEWPDPIAPAIETIFPEVDGFGISPLSSVVTADGLLINFRVPPGIVPGRHSVRLKIGSHGWSEATDIYVDLPALGNPIRIVEIQDGIDWSCGQVDWAKGGWATVWVEGLAAEADPGNTSVSIADIPHSPDIVFPDRQQINVKLRPVVVAGLCEVTVTHRGTTSPVRMVQVIGSPPKIKGLEALTE